MRKIIFGENLEVLKNLPNDFIDLVYIDPPFNTNKIQENKRKKGESIISIMSYEDRHEDFHSLIKERLVELYRILKPNGSLFFHIDYREVHYCKIILDEIFGRNSFINEIIWSYDYGARSKTRYSTKHDNILWYAKNPNQYIFNFEQIDRIPYMAPSLCGKEKAEKGKTITDVWWNTIVPTNGKERTGYPTQKPIKIIDRIVKMHSNENDLVLDCFAGSGTIGESCEKLNRNCILVDNNPEAIIVMKKRLNNFEFVEHKNGEMK